MNESEARAALGLVVGRSVVRVRRIFYVHAGEVNRTVGAIELLFHDGSIIYLDGGSDGQSLVVKSAPWIDPFEGVLTPENEEFVRTHGKWTRFDVSNEEEYEGLIGKAVDSIDLIQTPRGKVVGATFWLSLQRLRVEVEADDVYVQLTP